MVVSLGTSAVPAAPTADPGSSNKEGTIAHPGSVCHQAAEDSWTIRAGQQGLLHTGSFPWLRSVQSNLQILQRRSHCFHQQISYFLLSLAVSLCGTCTHRHGFKFLEHGGCQTWEDRLCFSRCLCIQRVPSSFSREHTFIGKFWFLEIGLSWEDTGSHNAFARKIISQVPDEISDLNTWELLYYPILQAPLKGDLAGLFLQREPNFSGSFGATAPYQTLLSIKSRKPDLSAADLCTLPNLWQEVSPAGVSAINLLWQCTQLRM